MLRLGREQILPNGGPQNSFCDILRSSSVIGDLRGPSSKIEHWNLKKSKDTAGEGKGLVLPDFMSLTGEGYPPGLHSSLGARISGERIAGVIINRVG